MKQTPPVLDVERINRLADLIESCDDLSPSAHYARFTQNETMGSSFTMAIPFYTCGSAACMIGHNQEMNQADTGRKYSHSYNLIRFADDLGITPDDAADLTSPGHEYADYGAMPGSPAFITAARAATTLRNLADTGEVNWWITS